MRELVSKLEGGCMSARFHLAPRARTRAAESYRRAKRRPLLGNSTSFFWGGLLPVSSGFDRYLDGSLTGFYSL